MKKIVIAAVALVALCVSGPAMATPSTQIWIPSTDTQPVVNNVPSVHLGVDNYTTFFKKQADGGHSAPTTYGITVGLVDLDILGMEVGIDFKEQSDDPVYYNAKIQLKEDSVLNWFPAIAFGVYDFGTKTDVTDSNIAYALLAKTFPVVGRLSLGYYVGNDKILVDRFGNKENDGFLASWDRTIAEIDDRLWVAVDYMDGNNSYGALSFGLAWRFSPNSSAIIGYDMYNDNSLAGEDTVTIQFDFDF